MTNNDITRLEMKKSLLLFSGGLDTTTILYMLCAEQIPVICLTFDYGQQATQEIKHAQKTCEKLNIQHEIMDLKKLGIGMEVGPNANIKNNMDLLVPNRNSIFLSIATNYAIKKGCENIYIGSKNNNPTYFDDSCGFIEQYNELNKVSDITTVKIKAPLMDYNTYEVIELALSLNVPLIDSWSCFGGKKERCGECINCKNIPEIVTPLIEDYESRLKQLYEYKSAHIPQKDN